MPMIGRRTDFMGQNYWIEWTSLLHPLFFAFCPLLAAASPPWGRALPRRNRGRPRRYESNPDRQRAYRARLLAKQLQPNEAKLPLLGRWPRALDARRRAGGSTDETRRK